MKKMIIVGLLSTFSGIVFGISTDDLWMKMCMSAGICGLVSMVFYVQTEQMKEMERRIYEKLNQSNLHA